MAKSQFEILQEVLSRLHEEGLLGKMIVIGSWCLPLYKEHYFNRKIVSVLRTRDVDFLVGRDTEFSKTIDLQLLLEDMGFILEQSYPDEHEKLSHPELIIEILVPEKGSGSSKPYKISGLSMKAQRLRYLDMLEKETLTVKAYGVILHIPHPVYYGFHKLVVANRRKKKGKTQMDLNSGFEVLDLLIEKGEISKLKEVFDSLTKKQQNTIKKHLLNNDREKIVSELC